jgi:lipopolysaccharide export system protein LptA
MNALRPLLTIFSALLITAISVAQSTPEQPTEISADHIDMTSSDTETTSIFTGNVVVTGTNLKLTCNRLEVVAIRSGDPKATIGEIEGFKSLIAEGNVRLRQEDREATCGRAIVLPGEDKLVLQDKPVIVDHSSKVTYSGDELEMHRGQRRVTGKNPRIIGPALKDLGVDTDKLLSVPESAPEAPKQP